MASSSSSLTGPQNLQRDGTVFNYSPAPTHPVTAVALSSMKYNSDIIVMPTGREPKQNCTDCYASSLEQFVVRTSEGTPIADISDLIQSFLSIGTPGMNLASYALLYKEVMGTDLARFVIEEDGPIEVQLIKAKERWLDFISKNFSCLKRSFKEGDCFIPDPNDLTPAEKAWVVDQEFRGVFNENTLTIQLLKKSDRMPQSIQDTAAMDRQIERQLLFAVYWRVFKAPHGASPEMQTAFDQMRALLDKAYAENLPTKDVIALIRNGYLKNKAGIPLTKAALQDLMHAATDAGAYLALKEVFWLLHEAGFYADNDMLNPFIDYCDVGLVFQIELFLFFGQQTGGVDFFRHIAVTLINLSLIPSEGVEVMPGYVKTIIRRVQELEAPLNTEDLLNILYSRLSRSNGGHRIQPNVVFEIQEALLSFMTEKNLIPTTPQELRTLKKAINSQAENGYHDAQRRLVKWAHEKNVAISYDFMDVANFPEGLQGWMTGEES